MDDIWRIWIKQVENCLASEQSLGSWKGDSCVLCQVRPFKIYQSDRHFYSQKSLRWRQRKYIDIAIKEIKQETNNTTRNYCLNVFIWMVTLLDLSTKAIKLIISQIWPEKNLSQLLTQGVQKFHKRSLTRVGVFIMISAFNQIVVCGLISLFF